jgi:hypothetical protein
LTIPLLFLLLFLTPALDRASSSAPSAGTLDVSFFYMPPTSIEPSYHTAIWLEDEHGALVRTLYISNDLSKTEYQIGQACPDWVKQAHWESANRTDVDAVTGPTPNVGAGRRTFDLEKLGLAPGRYRFKLQVHITEAYNILYSGPLVVSDAPSEVVLETFYSPSKPPGGTDFVRDVRARYLPRPVAQTFGTAGRPTQEMSCPTTSSIDAIF